MRFHAAVALGYCLLLSVAYGNTELTRLGETPSHFESDVAIQTENSGRDIRNAQSFPDSERHGDNRVLDKRHLRRSMSNAGRGQPSPQYIRCGKGQEKCPANSCCSKDGICGVSRRHCGVGCQAAFGRCTAPSQTVQEPNKIDFTSPSSVSKTPIPQTPSPQPAASPRQAPAHPQQQSSKTQQDTHQQPSPKPQQPTSRHQAPNLLQQPQQGTNSQPTTPKPQQPTNQQVQQPKSQQASKTQPTPNEQRKVQQPEVNATQRDGSSNDGTSDKIKTNPKGMPWEQMQPITQFPIVCKVPGLIALTFDDGPSLMTNMLLKALKELNVKATFFVTGSAIKQRETLLKKMDADGHQIGSRGWSRTTFVRMSQQQMKQELRSTEYLIEKTLRKRPTMFRFPTGEYDKTAADFVQKAGLKPIDWGFDSFDEESRDSRKIEYHYNWLADQLDSKKAGPITLHHESSADTIASLPAVIKVLRNKGFRFATVAECLGEQDGGYFKSTPSTAASQ